MAKEFKGNPFLQTGTDRLIVDYPWEFNEEQVERLLECCGKDREFPYAEGVTESKLTQKMGFKSWEEGEKDYFNKKCKKKVKYLIMGLRAHPAICTPRMREIIKDSKVLNDGIEIAKTEIVALGNQEVTVINGSDEEARPMVREETVKTDILEQLLDKTVMILDQITLGRVKKMSGSQMTRSIEGLVKSYTIFKGEVKATPIHVNIGRLTLNQKRELSRDLGNKE